MCQFPTGWLMRLLYRIFTYWILGLCYWTPLATWGISWPVTIGLKHCHDDYRHSKINTSAIKKCLCFQGPNVRAEGVCVRVESLRTAVKGEGHNKNAFGLRGAFDCSQLLPWLKAFQECLWSQGGPLVSGPNCKDRKRYRTAPFRVQFFSSHFYSRFVIFMYLGWF